MRFQFMGACPCGCSYAPIFLNLIRLANPLLKYANVCGLSDLRAVAHRLRTNALKEKKPFECWCKLKKCHRNKAACICKRVL